MQKKIVLIDISTYKVNLPGKHAILLQKRLAVQAKIQRQRLGIDFIRPPLTYSRGLLTMATALKEAGHEIHYVVHNDEKDCSRLSSLLTSADFVGMYAVTPSVGIASSIAKSIKETNPFIKIVIGGPGASAAPYETIKKYKGFDAIVIGPGDYVFPELVNDWDRAINLPSVVVDGSSNKNVYKVKLENYARKFQPAYELLLRPLNEYSHNVRTQEGCPYSCLFCSERMTWQEQQGMRSVDHVIEELWFLYEKCNPGTIIHFSDAIFNLNKERTSLLCKELNNLAKHFIFSIDTRAELINKESLSLMISAGIKYYRIGLEDSRESISKRAKKGNSLTEVKKAAALIRQASPCALVHIYWLTGLPGSTKKSMLENAYKVQELVSTGIVDIIGNVIFVPYPGSLYYERPQDYGLQLISQSWENYDRLSLPVYRLKNLSEHDIYDGYFFAQTLLTDAYLRKTSIQPKSTFKSYDYQYINYVNDRSTEYV